jgi:hypothetical protein
VAAFTIHSATHQTQSQIGTLYNFLCDFKNFQAILPEDKVENFEFSGDQCSFNIRGITPMKVRLVEKIPHESILFSTEGLAKFNFSLLVDFLGDSNQLGHCSVKLSGDLNPFIKAMAEKPLITLVNTMSLKLSELKLN